MDDLDGIRNCLGDPFPGLEPAAEVLRCALPLGNEPGTGLGGVAGRCTVTDHPVAGLAEH